MKQFTYTVTESIGIHAHPAGLLAKTVRSMDSTITVTKADGKTATASRLMSIMSLDVQSGETVTFNVEGGCEEDNAAAMLRFCMENL